MTIGLIRVWKEGTSKDVMVESSLDRVISSCAPVVNSVVVVAVIIDDGDCGEVVLCLYGKRLESFVP